MRASYDSIDNKQKMCEKVNKDITFIQFFHSTELFKIFFSLLTLQLLFCKKLVGQEKIIRRLLKPVHVSYNIPGDHSVIKESQITFFLKGLEFRSNNVIYRNTIICCHGFSV